MKKLRLGLFLFSLSYITQAQDWSTRPISVDGSTNKLGTSNKYPINIVTNDSVRMVVGDDGKVLLKKLEGTGYSLVYVDAQGNLGRSSGGNYGIPTAGSPCLTYGAPWYEGGNMASSTGVTTAGTCNNYDFILKANNVSSIFIKPSGKVGIGTGGPLAKFEVHETATLGSSDWDNNLIATLGAAVGSFHFKNNLWVVRDNTLGARIHDAISIGSSYETPGTDTKTWWERIAEADVQSWGNGMSTYMTLVQGKLGIGTLSPAAALQVKENTGVGATIGNYQLLTRVSGMANSNDVMNNLYLRRYKSTSGWPGAALHDGISVDASYGTPGTDTKTWWERRPNDDVQLWGNGSTAYMGLVNGKLWLGAQTQISPSTHTDALLTVNGKMIAKSCYISVSNWGNWPDYVFEKEYKLMPLTEVEAFVTKNKHLPNVPGIKELSDSNSLNVGEMQTVQMEKIEELFLYVINLQKEVERLKVQNAELEKKVKN